MSKYDMATMDIIHMDEVIARRRSELFTLCSQRNFLSLTCHLPIEILQAIFVQLAHDYYAEVCGNITLVAPSWVNVSYVCHHWRNTALNCPTLWSYLFVTSPRWTEELLLRSKHAPLKIDVKADGWEKITPACRFVEQIMDHVERIQEFHLNLLSIRGDHSFLSKLLSPAPHLQNLTITIKVIPRDWEFPSILFEGDTPALRTLDLVSCPVSWHSLKLSGLTTLSLQYIPVLFQKNIADLVNILKGMQSLVVLYLVNAIPSVAGVISSSSIHTTQKIHLPHLSRLWIGAPLSTMNALLSCIDVPMKTEVRLECKFEPGSSFDDYALLSPLLRQRLGASNNQAISPTIHSLVVKFWWEMVTIAFNAPARDHDVSVFPPQIKWGDNLPLQITINFDESTAPDLEHRDRTISSICSSLPLTNIQNLHVIDPPFSSAFWTKILEPLQDLRYLKLSCGYMPDLASVLSPSLPHGDMEGQDECAARNPDLVLVPALEELELHKVAFPAPMEPDMLLSADAQPLFDSLSSRRESRGQLTMIECVRAIGNPVVVNMVGRWEDGHFSIIEKSSRRPYDNPR